MSVLTLTLSLVLTMMMAPQAEAKTARRTTACLCQAHRQCIRWGLVPACEQDPPAWGCRLPLPRASRAGQAPLEASGGRPGDHPEDHIQASGAVRPHILASVVVLRRRRHHHPQALWTKMIRDSSNCDWISHSYVLIVVRRL